MTLTFNPVVYGSLLAELTPKAIESEAEYERTLALVEQLTFTQNRTPEHTVLHKLLVISIEAYEAEHYPISESSPDEILRHIMEASGTRQADLVVNYWLERYRVGNFRWQKSDRSVSS